jgi:hypothetical protein
MKNNLYTLNIKPPEIETILEKVNGSGDLNETSKNFLKEKISTVSNNTIILDRYELWCFTHLVYSLYVSEIDLDGESVSNIGLRLMNLADKFNSVICSKEYEDSSNPNLKDSYLLDQFES